MFNLYIEKTVTKVLKIVCFAAQGIVYLVIFLIYILILLRHLMMNF